MLRIKQTNEGGRSEWLVKKRYTFGTDEHNNYRVGGDISASQAYLDVDGDNIELVNLAGGPGVLINSDALLDERRALHPGDVFKVGDSEFMIEDPKLGRESLSLSEGASVPASGWSMKAKNTALENKLIVLRGEQTIGRAKDCDICLNVVHLSRHHARLKLADNTLFVEDLKSANGTFLNGKRITKSKVNSGDELAFDSLRFTVVGPKTNLEQTLGHGAFLDNDLTTVRPVLTDKNIKSALMSNKQVNKVGGERKPAPRVEDRTEISTNKPSRSAPPPQQTAAAEMEKKPSSANIEPSRESKPGGAAKKALLFVLMAAIGGLVFYYLNMK